MKTRVGFVSNSSSSSFLIVGTNDASYIKAVAINMGKYDQAADEYKIECSYGCEEYKNFNFYGSYDGPDYLGIDISKRIKKERFEDLKKEFQETIKKEHGVKIPLSQIDLHFGEVGE